MCNWKKKFKLKSKKYSDVKFSERYINFIKKYMEKTKPDWHNCKFVSKIYRRMAYARRNH